MPFAWVVLQLSVLAVIVLALELGGFTANHLISLRSVYEVLHISKEDFSLSLFALILSPILQTSTKARSALAIPEFCLCIYANNARDTLNFKSIAK